MAAYIAADSDWNFATLEMGINVIGDIEVGEFEERGSHARRDDRAPPS
jgi:hypothetical protein